MFEPYRIFVGGCTSFLCKLIFINTNYNSGFMYFVNFINRVKYILNKLFYR